MRTGAVGEKKRLKKIGFLRDGHVSTASELIIDIVIHCPLPIPRKGSCYF